MCVLLFISTIFHTYLLFVFPLDYYCPIQLCSERVIFSCMTPLIKTEWLTVYRITVYSRVLNMKPISPKIRSSEGCCFQNTEYMKAACWHGCGSKFIQALLTGKPNKLNVMISFVFSNLVSQYCCNSVEGNVYCIYAGGKKAIVSKGHVYKKQTRSRHNQLEKDMQILPGSKLQ